MNSSAAKLSQILNGLFFIGFVLSSGFFAGCDDTGEKAPGF